MNNVAKIICGAFKEANFVRTMSLKRKKAEKVNTVALILRGGFHKMPCPVVSKGIL